MLSKCYFSQNSTDCIWKKFKRQIFEHFSKLIVARYWNVQLCWTGMEQEGERVQQSQNLKFLVFGCTVVIKDVLECL